MAISGRVLSPPGRVDLKPAQGVGADSTSPGGEGVLDQNAAGLPSAIFSTAKRQSGRFGPHDEWNGAGLGRHARYGSAAAAKRHRGASRSQSAFRRCKLYSPESSERRG